MGIIIKDFRPAEKNTLQGFLTAHLTQSGLEIKDVAVHSRDGKRWIQLPAKPFEKPDGSKGWNYIVSITPKERYHQFQESTLEALDAFIAKQGEINESNRSQSRST
jgi:hypothetical protein